MKRPLTYVENERKREKAKHRRHTKDLMGEANKPFKASETHQQSLIPFPEAGA